MLMAMRLDLMDAEQIEALESIWANGALEFSMESLGAAYSKLALSQVGISLGLFAMIYATKKFSDGSREMAGVIGGLTGLFFGLAFAIQLYNSGILAAMSGPMAFATMAALIIATVATFAGLNIIMQDMMKAPKVELPTPENTMPTGDTGYYPMMDSGGLGSRHQAVMVEPGETIIPKTQNMVNGGAGGREITINIAGDVFDGDNFSEKVAEALPEALRKQNDVGGIF
jgi:hypothetical protein